VYAQNHLLTKEEIDKQYEEVINPTTEKDIKKIDVLINASKNINYKEGIGKGNLKMLYFYYNLSDYKKMLEIIWQTETLELKNNEQLSSLFIFKSYANGALGIQKEEFQNIKAALKYAKKIEEPDRRHFRTSIVYNRFSAYYDYKMPDSLIYYLKKELEELEKINDSDPENRKKKYYDIALSNINIGNFYLGVAQPQRLDLAEPYYMKVYNYRTTQPDIFEYHDMPILCGVGRFYMEKGEYEKSIKIANEVLQREKRKKNPTYRYFAYVLLDESYGGLNNPVEQVKYTKLHAALTDSLNKAAKQEVNQQFGKLVTNVEAKKEKEYSSNLKMILTGSGCFILILSLTTWFFWQRKNKNIQKKYEAIISKIKSEPQISENDEEIIENDESKATTGINDDTFKSLLVKLDKFEKSKLYLKNDISRPWLTSHLNTNTKYLFEVIKNYKGKNFTDYINGLRIEYITRKLVEDPIYREYKNEYLAEECGFNSRQVFITAFKKETGFTPSYFIDNLKSDAS